jgi:hypothetical protein
MIHRNRLPFGIVTLSLMALVACASQAERAGFDDGKTDPNKPAETTTPSGEFDKDKPPPSGEPALVNEVYGHSKDTLYRLDPITKAVTVVGPFKNCLPIIDIALDEKSTLYGASYEVLYTIDKNTATCSEIAKGDYPNSLSFVPKGTALPNEEALVGYVQGDYYRIDTKTGARTKLGALGGNLISSGDIVSVKSDGKNAARTYLTVKGGTQCNQKDCLVEVDPTTGKMLKNWGSIEHEEVFGLSFWAGKIYGFSNNGSLFEVTFGTNQLATTPIAIPQKPTGLSFWGAGSTTSAPIVENPQ